MNVLKPHLQTTIWTLLAASASQREIERVTGIDRKTIRGYQKRFAAMAANSPGVSTGPGGQTPPPRLPGPAAARSPATVSACEPHRSFIEAQLRESLDRRMRWIKQLGYRNKAIFMRRFIAIRAVVRNGAESSVAEHGIPDFQLIQFWHRTEHGVACCAFAPAHGSGGPGPI